MTTPHDVLSNAYAKGEGDTRRRDALAATFTPNPEMERILELQDRGDRLDVLTRVSLGHYLAARDAAGYNPDDHQNGDEAA